MTENIQELTGLSIPVHSAHIVFLFPSTNSEALESPTELIDKFETGVFAPILIPTFPVSTTFNCANEIVETKLMIKIKAIFFMAFDF